MFAQVDQHLALHRGNRCFAVGTDQCVDLRRGQHVQAVHHGEHAADRALHVLHPACTLRLCRHPVHRGPRRVQATSRVGQQPVRADHVRIGPRHGVQLQQGGVDPPARDRQLCCQPCLFVRIGRVCPSRLLAGPRSADTRLARSKVCRSWRRLTRLSSAAVKRSVPCTSAMAIKGSVQTTNSPARIQTQVRNPMGDALRAMQYSPEVRSL